MILTILLYIVAYLAFGFLIATPLIIWITKERVDEDSLAEPVLLSVLFPLFLTLSILEQLYLLLKRLGYWYVKLLKRIGT